MGGDGGALAPQQPKPTCGYWLIGPPGPQLDICPLLVREHVLGSSTARGSGFTR